VPCSIFRLRSRRHRLSKTMIPFHEEPVSRGRGEAQIVAEEGVCDAFDLRAVEEMGGSTQPHRNLSRLH
jgi:hypothetical protein